MPLPSGQQQPSLGALIVAKNEEDAIAAALHSLRPFARQIVVVDTGSNDQTTRISSRLGAEVYHFRWNENFSDARNFAIGHLRTDWIIALDADEQLDTGSMQEFARLSADPGCGGIRVTIRNYLDETGDRDRFQTHSYTRLFRRHPAFRYTGAVHEQIAPAIESAGFHIRESGILIHHDGYAEPSPEKVERNSALLRRELQERPDDPWLRYHLGLTEFAAGKHPEARRLLESALASSGLSGEQRETALLRLAQIALGAEDWTELKKRISFESTDVQREGFRRYLLGLSLSLQQQYGKALQALESSEVAASGLVNKEHLSSVLALCRKQVR